jgi:hypothetical protein
VLRCAKVFQADGNCVQDLFFEKAIERGGGQILGVDTFEVTKGGNDVVMDKDPVTKQEFCYTDYYHVFTYDTTRLDKMVDWNKWYNMGGEKEFKKVSDTSAWVDTFYSFFSPLEWGLPEGITLGGVLDVLLKNGLLAAASIMVYVVIYYISKLLVWIILYGLISFMWLKMAQRGVSIYVLLLVIFIILLVLGKFVSYDYFMSLLRGS